MKSRLILAIGILGLGGFLPASVGAASERHLTFENLSPLGRDRLECMLTKAPREGPESCGLESIDDCSDADCLGRHYRAWREILFHFAEWVPADWLAQLGKVENVPSYFLIAPEKTSQDVLDDLSDRCGGKEVGVGGLETCIFDTANRASSWRDVYYWLHGRDPQLPVGGK